jgi:hypothetical protein
VFTKGGELTKNEKLRLGMGETEEKITLIPQCLLWTVEKNKKIRELILSGTNVC